MSTNLPWAICYSDGTVRYDENGRAEIYRTIRDAIIRKSQLVAELEEVLEVRRIKVGR